MKPPYDITPEILYRIKSISEKIGEINAHYLTRPSPQLRKKNRIKTIQASLQIEGNTLSTEQITAIIDTKRIIGPKKDVLEVTNAIKAYERIGKFKPASEKDFLNAHKMLMNGLIQRPGNYRSKSVGIAKEQNIQHVAPPAVNVPYLMKDLFQYLNDKQELSLIKSCVFHYEMEFIHPFEDGNGRMGRLWQTIILMDEYPVFEFLPFETMISHTQKEYYKALAKSDKAGKSTAFIEYMLGAIDSSFDQMLNFNQRIFTEADRLDYFMNTGPKEFTRKEYMNVFKSISSATASRDLKSGVDSGLFIKSGTHNKTKYYLK
ncbi:MAG: Fic family protein [Saprospiraceae bacterium]